MGDQRAEGVYPLQLILDALPVPIFYKDAQGLYRGCNRAFERYLGRPRDQILGLPVEGLSPPELARTYRAADEKLLASREPQVYEARVRDAAGTLHDVVFSKGVFLDESGAAAGLAGTILDITEYKQAEHAQQLRDQMFRAAFHRSGLGMALLDEAGSLLDFNRVLAGLLGRSDGELRSMSFPDALHPDDREGGSLVLDALVRGAQDHSEMECRLGQGGGAYAQVRCALSAIRDEEGKFRFAMALVEDVTAKVRAEEALRRSEHSLQMADRLASVGTLAAGVAHEINNPLACLSANLQFSRDALSGSGPPEVLEALGEAAEAAGRMARIVADLRAFSRVDEEVGPVDLPAILHSTANLVRSLLVGRGRLDLDAGTSARVQANAPRLGQVFLNLLVNAVQALREGPAEANVVRVSARVDAGWVVVEVRDNGVGIPAAIRHRIFDPFFTTKPAGVGTGLGLAISHSIVTGLGGTIEVESQVGSGTIFRVRLPEARSAEVRPVTPIPSPPVGHPFRRVLVVDDEPLIGRALHRRLRPAEVVTETSARDALARLDAGEVYDLVLCDLSMPGAGGVDFCRRLEESHPAHARRTIIMTGGARDAEVRALAEHPGRRVLHKPFSDEEFRRILGDPASWGAGTSTDARAASAT